MICQNYGGRPLRLKALIVLRDCVHVCPVVAVPDEGPVMLSDLPHWPCAVWSPPGSRGNVAWKRTRTAGLTHTWPRLMAPQIFIIILPNSSQIWPRARALPPKSTEVKYVRSACLAATWQWSRDTFNACSDFIISVQQCSIAIQMDRLYVSVDFQKVPWSHM